MARYHLSVKSNQTQRREKAEELDREAELKLGPTTIARERRAQLVAKTEVRDCLLLTQRRALVHTVRQPKAVSPNMRERLELAREAYAEAREEGRGHFSVGLAVLCAAAGRQARELDQDEIEPRLARIAGQEQGEEHNLALGQNNRDIRGWLADVLDKASAENQERGKARQKEREQERDEERKRQRELDGNLGWEMCSQTRKRFQYLVSRRIIECNWVEQEPLRGRSRWQYIPRPTRQTTLTLGKPRAAPRKRNKTN